MERSNTAEPSRPMAYMVAAMLDGMLDNELRLVGLSCLSISFVF